MASIRRPACAWVAAVVIAAVMSACGESDSSDAADTAAGETLGPVNLVDCTDWNRGSDEKREGTIEEIREFAGGPVAASGGGEGAVVSTDQAHRLFENTCANEYARGFKLYKLYSRGAAFSGP
jgi:hypothetical protein